MILNILNLWESKRTTKNLGDDSIKNNQSLIKYITFILKFLDRIIKIYNIYIYL
jgi:hypothetical protein